MTGIILIKMRTLFFCITSHSNSVFKINIAQQNLSSYRINSKSSISLSSIYLSFVKSYITSYIVKDKVNCNKVNVYKELKKKKLTLFINLWLI